MRKMIIAGKFFLLLGITDVIGIVAFFSPRSRIKLYRLFVAFPAAKLELEHSML